jgi:internalin A
VHLDLSMNKIAAVQGSFDCPNLRRLIMSDNLLREISPFMLQKCKSLRALNLDINQISKIANLQHLTDLTELSLQNNRISVIEGLSSLTKLRKLNLSFNQIRRLEGISALQMLEFLELGKN